MAGHMQITVKVDGIGAALRVERVARMKRLYEVAGRAGIDPSRLTKFERGAVELRPDQIQAIREAIYAD